VTICDVNYCARGAKLPNASYNVNDISAPFVISPLSAVNSSPKPSIKWKLM